MLYVNVILFQCPVFDNERDILYDGYYLTMTRRGGITLTVRYIIQHSLFKYSANKTYYIVIQVSRF